MSAQLKAEKEAFVTGHSGTTMLEVATVVAVGPVCSAQRWQGYVSPFARGTGFHGAVPHDTRRVGPGQEWCAWGNVSARLTSKLVLQPVHRAASFGIEMATLAFPTLLCFTQAHAAPYVLIAMVALVCILEARLHALDGRRRLRNPFAAERAEAATVVVKRLTTPRRLLFLSHYRGGMLLVTCVTRHEQCCVLRRSRAGCCRGRIVCILAVDFAVFPRRFAKCEEYGVSLVRRGWLSVCADVLCA